MAEATITYADEACAIGTVANVCAVVWRGECTAARNDEWIRTTHDLARRLGTPIAVVSTLVQGAPAPPASIRNAQSRFLEGLSRTACAAGVIVDGAGLRAGMVRAVIASVNALTRDRCPSRVAADDAEMARWLHEQSARLPPSAARADERELRSFFAALRARVQR